MSRNRDKRMDGIVDATVQTIARNGLPQLRIKDIAAEAEVSERLVSYYYPQLEDLVSATHRKASERYYWNRLNAIDKHLNPTKALTGLIESGLPSGREDVLTRVLFELSLSAARSEQHEQLMSDLYRDEVSLYQRVLEKGRDTGDFVLAAEPLALARAFIAMEDGLGLQIIAGSGALSTAQARGILLRFAAVATGAGIEHPDADSGS
ncbi:TetR/AcrR family transcriptional regulator [Paeniglutamicibacter cryotolerans]|uniref:DNA-binding transcriptional regulator YbjK n=1 Tax=Paeniglutamicibacter cryotolerans TaxID=670079 RepID=A0A839QJH7_9MICC|nr:TetR family transcriptional regulator C-terminal domain-containing protein [Paeniglutamicibacter cryotolerans]MBB2995753.1 DNA-binding transcriptional regulator YbjK [Paeniglutamicibacter cryotolerans]